MPGRLSDAAYQRLKDMIITLELPPGRPLAEKDLTALLDVGRTPAREALQRLALEGLVTVVPRQGTFVAEANVADLRSILELRLTLEPFCARLAAQRRTAADVDAMRRVLSQWEAPPDRNLAYKLDLAFHRTISAAARNPKLADILEGLQTQSMRFFQYLRASRQPLGEVLRQHGALVDAIEQGDEEEAARVMLAHVDIARSLLLSAVGGAAAV